MTKLEDFEEFVSGGHSETRPKWRESIRAMQELDERMRDLGPLIEMQQTQECTPEKEARWEANRRECEVFWSSVNDEDIWYTPEKRP